MVDKIDDNVRAAAVAAIRIKAQALIEERQELREQIALLETRIRRNEIAIFDCRGAARLFDADITLPEDMATARAVWVRRIMDEGAPRPPSASAPPSAIRPPSATPPHGVPPSLFGYPAPRTILGSAGTVEPSVREIAIEQLRRAGEAGAKAAVIRQVAESILKKKLHEKTVGMTLYRLSKDGIARREGQTWFFVPPKSAETKNPGGSAPGSVDARSKRKEEET